MSKVLSVLFGLLVIFAANPVGADEFKSCAEVMRGSRCETLSRNSDVFKMCCPSRPSATEDALDEFDKMNQLELSIHNLRLDLLACREKQTSLDRRADACTRRGCFCGIDDSRIPDSCFNGPEVCCDQRMKSDLGTLPEARKTEKDLRDGMFSCKDTIARLREERRPPAGGFDGPARPSSSGSVK